MTMNRKNEKCIQIVDNSLNMFYWLIKQGVSENYVPLANK